MHGDRALLIKARVSPEEKGALVAIAEKEHRSLSEALREVLREGAAARGLWPPTETEQEQAKAA